MLTGIIILYIVTHNRMNTIRIPVGKLRNARTNKTFKLTCEYDNKHILKKEDTKSGTLFVWLTVMPSIWFLRAP